MEGEAPKKNMRSYSTSKAGGKNSIYVAELAHDASTSKITKARKITFYYDLVSDTNVKVNGESYSNWLKRIDSNLSVLREDLYFNNQIMQNIVSNIFTGVDLKTSEKYKESEVPQEPETKSVNPSNEMEFSIPTWEDFHFTSH